jgi:predicted esterase
MRAMEHRLRAVAVLAAIMTTATALSAAPPAPVVKDVAFKAKCDGTTQRYMMVLPPKFKLGERCDLMIALHGHGSDRHQFAEDQRDECRAARDAAAKRGMIYVSPDYRATTSWMGPKAETDVVQIIGDIKKRHDIRHVLVCGASMGGSSALTFAARRPDLVDGVVSMNGTANHLEYTNFQDAIQESFGGTKAEVPEEYKKRSAEYWPERLTMPVAITAGAKDDVVPCGSVVRLAGVLEKMNREVLLILQPEGGHSTTYEDAMKAFDFVLERMAYTVGNWQEGSLLYVEAAAPVFIRLPKGASPLVRRIGRILASRIAERCPPSKYVFDAEISISLRIKPGIGKEGFSIADDGFLRKIITITGNDERGLLFGVGKFLHTSSVGPMGFNPSKWRGASVPAKPLRGIYFATHFRNWYEEAPVEEVQRYVEDMSLWGVNSYLVWFGIDAYNGIDDPKAQAMLARLRVLLKTVKDLGMNTGLGCVANDAYANSPVELRADSTVGHDGYHLNWLGGALFNLGPELCPSKPGVPELEIQYCKDKFDAFKDIGLDLWFIAPYDNGGCTCTKCAPWGVNGYLRMAELEARAYLKAFPKGQVVLSTWYFDKWIDGEWKGITDKFNAKKPDWLHYIMADDYGGVYPPYPLAHGAPGGFPLLNFPEISMYAHYPWGGYGAIPLPKYLQKLWDATKGMASGGFPYSEGVFEDVNKAMCAQLYWDPKKPTTKTMREYAAYHFSPEVADDVCRAMATLERNLERAREDKDGVTKIVMKSTAGAAEAFKLIAKADAKLPDRVRASWRWRLVYLRALIDSELAKHEFRVSEKCAAAFKELTEIYHAQHARDMIMPPTNLSGVAKDRP